MKNEGMINNCQVFRHNGFGHWAPREFQVSFSLSES
jgi:hypothetical protein